MKWFSQTNVLLFLKFLSPHKNSQGKTRNLSCGSHYVQQWRAVAGGFQREVKKAKMCGIRTFRLLIEDASLQT